MATYIFKDLNGGAEITNPAVSISGTVGTNVLNNVPEGNAWADIILETPQAKFAYRLEGSPEPVSWTMEDLGIWVSQQLVKYEV